MKGNLEQRGKDVWRLRVFVGRDPETGNPRFVKRTVHGSKRQAQAALNALLVEVGSQRIGPEDGTFGDLASRWMEQSADALSPTTVRGYRDLLDRILLPRFGTTKVRLIRAADLDALYTDLRRRGAPGGGPLSAQSIRHVHALARRLLNQAVKWGWIASNPAQAASPPRVTKPELTIPPPDVLGRILEAATKQDPALGLFLRLSAVTGARRGELCALHWSDIDGPDLRIRASIVDGRSDALIEKDTKTHAARRVTLDPTTARLLSEHHGRALALADLAGGMLLRDGYVFSDEPDGRTPWRPGRVTLAFGRLCRALDAPGVRLHDLRHFAATQLLAAGVPVKTVSSRLGHANAATTLNIYAHALQASDEAAATTLGVLLDSPNPTTVTRLPPETTA